jgi:hypothetical protein
MRDHAEKLMGKKSLFWLLGDRRSSPPPRKDSGSCANSGCITLSAVDISSLGFNQGILGELPILIAYQLDLF